MLNIAIVEDEKEMSNCLRDYLIKFFNEENISIDVSIFDNGNIFLEKYKLNYNLIFLDIKMPSIDGMEVAQKIRKIDKNVMIIFVTSLAQYAIKGYEVNAFDYILKPIDYYNFKLKMSRTLSFLNNNNRSFIVEIYDHRLYFHLNNNENISSYGTMKTYIDLLKNDSFMLCNQCYFVNLKYVREVTSDYVLVGENKLSISRPKRQEFIHALNNYLSSGDK